MRYTQVLYRLLGRWGTTIAELRLWLVAGSDHSVREEVLNIDEANGDVSLIDNEELVDLPLLNDSGCFLSELIRVNGDRGARAQLANWSFQELGVVIEAPS